MKIIERTLLVSYILLLIGILNRILTINQNLNILTVISLFIFIVFSPVYLIITLRKKKNRIDSIMILISLPMILSIHFMLMFWEGGSYLAVSGNSFVLLGSIAILIYSLVKKVDSVRAVLYAGLGFGALYFCFRFLFWEYSQVMILPSVIAVVVAFVLNFKEKRKLDVQHWVSLSILALLFISLLGKRSTIYRIRYVDTFNKELNDPETLYSYAWYLYNDSEKQKAIESIDQGIKQLNTQIAKYENYEMLKLKYENTIEKISNGSWVTLEKVQSYH